MDIKELKTEWSEKNTIEIEQASTGKKYWWKCNKGHEWIAFLGNRKYQNTGCPYCKSKLPTFDNNLKVKYPNISNEWDDSNDDDPENYLPNSNKKIKWKCKFGHTWVSSIINRTKNNNNCPFCFRNESWCENYIFSVISQFFSVEKHLNPEIDIYIKSLNIGIEYDGYYHKFRQESDIRKNEWSSKNLNLLIRIREKYLPDLPPCHNVMIIKQNDSSKKSCISSIISIFEILSVDYNDIEFDVSVDGKVRNFQIPMEVIKSWSDKNQIDISKALKTHKYLWVCGKCRSDYISTYRDRLKKECCPYCASQKINSTNCLKSTHPYMIRYLSKNNDLDPTTVTYGTSKKMKFVLSGKEYFTTPRNFNRIIKSFESFRLIL